MVERELVSDMLSKYDLEKNEIKNKYKKRQICSLVMTVVSVILILVGNLVDEYVGVFIFVSLIVFIISCKLAKSAKNNYRESLGNVWYRFSNKEFAQLIAHSLDNGKCSVGVEDETFNSLATVFNTRTFGAVGCDYKGERITVVNYYAYSIEEDSYTGTSYNRRWFDGVAVMKSIKKKVESEIVIAPYQFADASHLNKVSMDNSKFNKIFNVCTQDNKDAYISLTPEVMECLMELTDKFAVSAILVKENKVYVFFDYEKMIFDIQDEKLRKVKGYKKALKYMTVDFTIQNIAKFNEKYFRIVDSVKKINV